MVVMPKPTIEDRLLKHIIKGRVRQGGHEDRITALYALIYECMQEEFTEDNRPTLEAFATDCFTAALIERRI